MNLAASASLVHTIVLDVRRRLQQRGATGSTILAAEATLAHLMPLLLAGRHVDTCERLAEQCGRSQASLRRSLRALARSGVLQSRALGCYGIELYFLLPHREGDEA